VDKASARKLGVVFKREYLERVRSKWFLVGTLLGPVFFAMITVVPILISSKTKASTDLANVVIIDATASGMGERVAGALQQRYPLSPLPEVKSVDPASIAREEDRAMLAVRDKERRGYLVLDSSTVAGNSVRYAGGSRCWPSVSRAKASTRSAWRRSPACGSRWSPRRSATTGARREAGSAT
jgi:ABC-2 type transport system permease protein